jgi:hypothetical protein
MAQFADLCICLKSSPPLPLINMWGKVLSNKGTVIGKDVKEFPPQIRDD